MANIFTDSFYETGTGNTNLTAHTATTGTSSNGGTWSRVAGYGTDGAVVVGTLDDCHPQGSFCIYYTSGVPSSADYQVTCDMTYVSTSSQDKDVGLTVRQDTGGPTCYLLRRTGGGAGTWDCYRLVSGSATLIAGPYTQSLSNGVAYGMFLSSTGTGSIVTVTAKIDGVNLSGSPFDDNDASRITSTGRPGAWFDTALGSQQNTMDNYSADDIASGPTTYTKTTSLDALIAKQNQLVTTSIDALLKKTQSLQTQIDALAKATKTQTTGLDGLVSKTSTQTTSLDAIVSASKFQTTSLDALLNATLRLTTSLDAVVTNTQAITTQVDALIKRTMPQTTSLDALIRSTLEVSTMVDAIIKRQGTTTTGIDAHLRKLYALTTSINALIKKTGTKTISIDAIISTVDGWVIQTDNADSWSVQALNNSSWSIQ